MADDKPFPLPPREMRAQLGIPEDIDEGTIQDLFYGKPLPPPNLQEMFSPLQAGREALPTAVEAGALVGGGILAGGGGIPGIIAAGGLNVFGRHLANKMRALNEGQILPDRANPAVVSTDFILGAAQAMVPVAKGPLGFVQQGLTQAGIGQAENLAEGKPLSMQQAGESALMGAGMHGGFQAAGKLAGKVLPLRTEVHSENPIETNRRVPLTTLLSGERGSALMGNLKPPTPDSMGFYSRLKHFADNLPDNAAHNPLALANQLQKGVTSKLELDETGVLPWLREQKGKVTSQQVRDYVDQHQIKVEEKMLGGGPTRPEYQVLRPIFDDDGNTIGHEVVLRTDSRGAARLRADTIGGSIEKVPVPVEPTKWNRPETLTPFEHGSEPGSYRELVMTLPDKQTLAMDAYNNRFTELSNKHGDPTVRRLMQMITPEEKADLDRLSKTVSESRSTPFTSSHYSDILNPLLHMRFDSRISPDGKKTLFLHEIQSDWHQKGRERGYADPNALLEAESNVKGTVPNAPFKQTHEWTALGLKRLLRYAAENGYDRIAWTPGEAQAERYDLSKHIDRISYVKNRDGSINMSAHKDGVNISQPIGLPEKIPMQDVAKYVGKEIAEKIQNGGNHGAFEGLDLKVGGEGMKGFYGSPAENNLGIVGGVMNDLGKKWGARVGKSRMPASDTYRDTTLPGGNKILFNERQINEPEVHSLDLPDSLKQDVKQKGQPIASISDIFPMKERQA